jgi:hypothetical protein
MIRANINEQFTVTVSLVDESLGVMATGRTVYYDMRTYPGDGLLSPPSSGTLTESSVEAGVYSKSFTLSEAGEYIVYTSCNDFTSGAENITIDSDNLAALVKQNRHYNLGVEDVIRENAIATASQTARKVALGNTDYIINRIKYDGDIDWSGTVVSGIVYAHYRNESDSVPYLMGGPF